MKTHNGDIRTGNIGRYCEIISHNGEVTVGNVGSNSRIQSHNADVSAENVGQNATVQSHNSDVRVRSRHSSAEVRSYNGRAYVDGRRIVEEPRRGGDVDSIFIGSFMNGSVVTIGDSGSTSQRLLTAGSFRPRISRIAQAEHTTYSRREPSVPAAAETTHSTARTEYTEEMQGYLRSFSDKQESFAETFERLQIDISKSFQCPVSLDVPNKPVLVHGHLYDLESLLSLPMENDGFRREPLDRELFQLGDISPAYPIRDFIQEKIQMAEDKARLGSSKTLAS